MFLHILLLFCFPIQQQNNIKLLTPALSESQQVNNTAHLLPNPKSVQNRSAKLLQVVQPGEITSTAAEKVRWDRKTGSDTNR